MFAMLDRLGMTYINDETLYFDLDRLQHKSLGSNIALGKSCAFPSPFHLVIFIAPSPPPQGLCR